MKSIYTQALLVAVGSLLISFSAQSAQIQLGCLGLKTISICVMPSIEISGEIIPGDHEKLKLAINESSKDSRRQKIIVLNSQGGDLAEALKMAELIRPLYFETRVQYDGYCASSCFFVWLSGAPRRGLAADTIKELKKITSPDRRRGVVSGMVGLHRPYLRNPLEPDPRQKDIMLTIRKMLEDSMVPRYLIDIMMSRPSNDVYWLSTEDFNAIGEYSPEVEELLIKKCDYFRSTPDNIAARGFDKAIQAYNCVFDLTEGLHMKAYSRHSK